MPMRIGLTTTAASLSAGWTVLVGVAAQADAWSATATMIMAAAGVVVTSGLGLLALVDRARIARNKAWDDANKESLSAQLAKLAEECEARDVAAHKDMANLRTNLLASHTDNAALRDEVRSLYKQLGEFSDRLHATDKQILDAKREGVNQAIERANNTARIEKLEADAQPPRP